MYKLCAFFIILILSIGNIWAANLKDTTPISLPGGNVNPKGGTLTIPLLKLISNATYLVYCDIINKNFGKIYPIILKTGYSYRINYLPQYNFSIWLNGKQINEQNQMYGQGKLNQLTNKYIIKHMEVVDTTAYIYFINYDNKLKK